jgi:DNA topoisomerase-1
MCRRNADLSDRHGFCFTSGWRNTWKQLGNTKAVCRKCYIHPAILAAYIDGATIETLNTRASRLSRSSGLSPDERAIVRLIRQRIGRGQH